VERLTAGGQLTGCGRVAGGFGCAIAILIRVLQGLRVALPYATGPPKTAAGPLIQSAVPRRLHGEGTPLPRLWRSGPLQIPAGDVELAHHGVQGGAMQAQPGGGQCDHSSAFPQYAQNMIALHLF
jgi:hypothetical protein